MLIYNPAFDIQHAIFRMLRLLVAAEKKDFAVQQVRLLDFLLLFPEQLEAMRFPNAMRRQRSLFVKDYNPYRTVEDPHRVFLELEPFQIAALHCLAAYGLIDGEKLKDDFVRRSDRPVPEKLLDVIQKRNTETKILVDLLSLQLSSLPFFGGGGLKERSNLLSTRYDPA